MLIVLLAAAFALQVDEKPAQSILTAPLYLEEEPPECRSLRLIRLAFDGGDERGRERPGVGRTREQAAVMARNLLGLIEAGADFAQLATAHSQAPGAKKGGVLGTYPPGVLVPAFDHFLFSAELGKVSQPIDIDGALHLLQRIDRWAACRQIVLKGRSDEVCALAQELFERLQAGADFEELARAHSDDPASAERGGAWRLFERGAKDALLKEAVFTADVGEVFGPLESPLGFHIGRRDAIEGFDPSLRENNWVRGRAVLIAHRQGTAIRENRSLRVAARLAREIHAAAQHETADLAELARRHTDDPGGKERRGDLGWIYRDNPNRVRSLDRLFLAKSGALLEPMSSEEGWIVLQRTR